jgi:hypothetical protein
MPSRRASSRRPGPARLRRSRRPQGVRRRVYRQHPGAGRSGPLAEARAIAKRDIVEALPALRALGLFDVFLIRDDKLRAFVDALSGGARRGTGPVGNASRKTAPRLRRRSSPSSIPTWGADWSPIGWTLPGHNYDQKRPRQRAQWGEAPALSDIGARMRRASPMIISVFWTFAASETGHLRLLRYPR